MQVGGSMVVKRDVNNFHKSSSCNVVPLYCCSYSVPHLMDLLNGIPHFALICMHSSVTGSQVKNCVPTHGSRNKAWYILISITSNGPNRYNQAKRLAAGIESNHVAQVGVTRAAPQS